MQLQFLASRRENSAFTMSTPFPYRFLFIPLLILGALAEGHAQGVFAQADYGIGTGRGSYAVRAGYRYVLGPRWVAEGLLGYRNYGNLFDSMNALGGGQLDEVPLSDGSLPDERRFADYEIREHQVVTGLAVGYQAGRWTFGYGLRPAIALDQRIRVSTQMLFFDLDDPVETDLLVEEGEPFFESGKRTTLAISSAFRLYHALSVDLGVDEHLAVRFALELPLGQAELTRTEERQDCEFCPTRRGVTDRFAVAPGSLAVGLRYYF